MDVSRPGGVGQEYGARVAVKAMQVAKQQGEAAVELIEGAAKAAPPQGLQGQGANVNTYG